MYPLLDNYKTDPAAYELHVYTGNKKHADTQSNISFVVWGTEGSSGIRRLRDGVREVSKSVCQSAVLFNVLLNRTNYEGRITHFRRNIHFKIKMYPQLMNKVKLQGSFSKKSKFLKLIVNFVVHYNGPFSINGCIGYFLSFENGFLPFSE